MGANTDTVWQENATGVWDKSFPMEKADHAMGLELQIVELVEQQTRARVQHRDEDALRYDGEIAQLRAELVATAEVAFPVDVVRPDE